MSPIVSSSPCPRSSPDRRPCGWACGLLLIGSLAAAPQETPVPPPAPITSPAAVPHPAKPTAIDERIADMLAGIERRRLEEMLRELVGFGTRHVDSAIDAPDRGTGAARAYLQEQLESFIPLSEGRLTVERKEYEVFSTRLDKKVQLVNIVATLRGVSDPSRVYVVSGHYDSINSDVRDGEGAAPGANDDGSGTCVVVEACRVMSSREFPATIMFVCYDGEEQGLLGSSEHAKELHSAGALVDGMITNDIVGNTLGMDGVRRRDYLRCFSYSPIGNDSPGRSMARLAVYAAARHVRDCKVRLVFRGDRYGRGGDHRSFHQYGFPSIRCTEPREDYSRQHQNVVIRDGKPYGDLPEFVDYEYMARVVAVNVALLSHLASAPKAPSRVWALGSRSAYDTEVQWESVAPGVRYEAVWRDTTAPDWQHSAPLDSPERGRGRLTALLKNVCLDEVVIGVRSVGEDGSRSRVTATYEPDNVSQRGAGRRDR